MVVLVTYVCKGGRCNRWKSATVKLLVVVVMAVVVEVVEVVLVVLIVVVVVVWVVGVVVGYWW